MLIAQISDTRVQLPGGLLDRNYDTAGNLERAVRHLNAHTPQLDVVLLTGDTVDAGSPGVHFFRPTSDIIRGSLFFIGGFVENLCLPQIYEYSKYAKLRHLKRARRPRST